MRFTASYDEHMGKEAHKDLGADNDLQALVSRLYELGVNESHCIITEYDLDDLDFYGIPEIVAQTRLVHIDKNMNDLQDFIDYLSF